jgi:hypothetical protein
MHGACKGVKVTGWEATGSYQSAAIWHLASVIANYLGVSERK